MLSFCAFNKEKEKEELRKEMSYFWLTGSQIDYDYEKLHGRADLDFDMRK